MRSRAAESKRRDARRGERGLAAQDFRPRRGELRPRAVAVGERRRPVELDQHVARPHEGPVAYPNGLDPAGLERLDDLDLAPRLKLALRGGDNVDPAEIGPGERGHDQRADDPQESETNRRGRRLQDLERRGEKLAIAEIHSPSLAGGLEPREGARGEQPGARRRLGRGRGRDSGHAATSAGWL